MTDSPRTAAQIVYSDSREPYVPIIGSGLMDADRNARRGWLVGGQLWERLAETGHDHDMGGCTCGCPVSDCEPCGGADIRQTGQV
jgi:hypothetical protein